MIVLGLILIFYLLPAVITYRWMRIAHGPKGIYYPIDPSMDDIKDVILPIYNIASAIITLEESPYDNPVKKDHTRMIRKFFLLKPVNDDESDL